MQGFTVRGFSVEGFRLKGLGALDLRRKLRLVVTTSAEHSTHTHTHMRARHKHHSKHAQGLRLRRAAGKSLGGLGFNV